MEVLLTDYIEPGDLRAFEQKFFDEQRSNTLTVKTRFEYAWALIKSKYKGDVRRGIGLLEELGHDVEATHKRDYLFYLAVANTKLGDYERALQLIDSFLKLEPRNRQGLELRGIIKERIKKEGLRGAAIAGGAALVVGGLVTLGLALTGKK